MHSGLTRSQMLADVLAKTGCEREPRLSALFDGKGQLEPTEDAKARKASIRASRHARKQLAVRDGCEFPLDHGSSTAISSN